MVKALPLLLVLLTACAPTLPELVGQRHYNEALCAYDALDIEEQAQVRASLVEAMLTDLEPAYHVHEVTLEELSTIMPSEVAERVLERVMLVRLTYDSHELRSLESFSMGLKLLHAGEPVPEIPIEREELALLTGETLPGPRTRTVRTPEPEYFWALPFAMLGDVILLGQGEFTVKTFEAMRGEPETAVIEPSQVDYFAAAPATEALYHATWDAWCSGEPGTRCETFRVFERRGGPLEMELSGHFTADMFCGVYTSQQVSLPVTGDIAMRAFRP